VPLRRLVAQVHVRRNSETGQCPSPVCVTRSSCVHSRETLRRVAVLVCSEPIRRGSTKREVTDKLCARLQQVQDALCLLRDAGRLPPAADEEARPVPQGAAGGEPAQASSDRVSTIPAVTWKEYVAERLPDFIREAGLAHLESVCAQRNSSSGGGTGAPAASTRSAAGAGVAAAARAFADNFDELRVHIAESEGASHHHQRIRVGSPQHMHCALT
jgi:hypothetical protein